MNNVIVSIVCLTYNHEQYIHDCLNGFLKQKTTFPFELLIHDDCSFDKTTDIIREYEAKYPNIIKPIYQKDNQYSKGKNPAIEFLYPICTGKYIALCEGDDYWTDPYKLQKQVDFLETHEDVSMCFHDAKIIYSAENRIGSFRRYSNNQYVPVEDLIIGGGGFCPTASLVFRTQYIQYGYPDFCINCHTGDFPLQLYLSTKGKIFYFSEEMSAYRHTTSGSWSKNFKNTDLSVKIKKWMSEYVMIDGINALHEYKYASAVIRWQTDFFIGDILLPNRGKKTEIKKVFGTYISKFLIKNKIKIFLICHAFFLYRLLSKLSALKIKK